MLTINGLDFSFGEKTLFENLDLHVERGEHVVIVGDSGGGKSSLLSLIVDSASPAIQLDRQSSATMVLQEGALLDHLNVIDNLRLVARYNRASGGSEISDVEIEQVLRQLNIDSSLFKAKVSQLSGGQMRRVAIARALLTSPDLILFDEPDAGLDLANLVKLADTVNDLSTIKNKACMTVSHNPFYIAQVASKVYRLQGKRLTLLADWPSLPISKQELHDRQLALQAQLEEVLEPITGCPATSKREWPAGKWLIGLAASLASVPHIPRSPRDEFSIAAYTFYLSFISGAIFFALVGLMLGSTIIAVVRMLADNSLTGLVSYFVKPENLIDMMGGRYVLYLAPAIGAMLFAARSGSIVSNWLGEMVRGKRVRALQLLSVPGSQYLRAPSALALFLAMFCTICWFTASVWLGGVIATSQLFDVPAPEDVMALSAYDLRASFFLLKTLVYSTVVSLTIVALGLAPKETAHQLNVHTTKTIIYSTLSVAFAELAIILL